MPARLSQEEAFKVVAAELADPGVSHSFAVRCAAAAIREIQGLQLRRVRPKQERLPEMPAPEPKRYEPSWQQKLVEEWVSVWRDMALEEAGLPRVPEQVSPAFANASVKRMLEGVEEGRREMVWREMCDWFRQQPWAGFHRGVPREPPWPFGMFATERVWRQARQVADRADQAADASSTEAP